MYALLTDLENWWHTEHDQDLWDFAPTEFWRLLESDDQEDVVRIAKRLAPWLAAIIEQAEGSQVGHSFGRRQA